MHILEIIIDGFKSYSARTIIKGKSTKIFCYYV